MIIPKVKVFKRTTYDKLEESINKFIRQNGIQAEDIVSVSFANGEGGYMDYSALLVYKDEY